jgi:hypothetical protein
MGIEVKSLGKSGKDGTVKWAARRCSHSESPCPPNSEKTPVSAENLSKNGVLADIGGLGGHGGHENAQIIARGADYVEVEF